MAKTLSNYNPTVNIGGGITPAGGEFPVAESHDILVDSTGKRLDTKLDELDAQIGGTGETSVATQLGQKVAKSDITTAAPASTNTDAQVPSTKSMYTALATKPTGTLSTAKPVSGSTDTQIPTSKAVYTGLAEKVDTANITTAAPASTNTDAQVPSTKSMYTALATKPTGTLSTAEPVSSSTDTQIPTAKAVYTGLNKKINTADIASTVAATGSTSATKVPSETAVRAAIEAKTIPLESSVPAAGDSPSATAAPSVAATRTAIDAAIDDASQDFEDAAAALQTSYNTFTSAIDAKIGDPTDAADDGATAVWPRLKNAETDIDALSGQFLIADALTTAKMADNTRFYIYTGKEIRVVNATTDITDTTGNIIYKYIGATSGNFTQNNLYQYDTGTSAYVAVTAANALNITVEGSSTAGTIYRPNYWFYYDTNTWKQGSNVSSVTVDSTLSIAGAAADAKATGDAITELSNDFQLNQESLTSLSSNFILNYETFLNENGFYNGNADRAGRFETNSTYYSRNTDFIETKPGDIFVYYGNSWAAAKPAIFYDLDKNFVGIISAYQSSNTYNYNVKHIITTPNNENIKFVRFCSLGYRNEDATKAYEPDLTVYPLNINGIHNLYNDQVKEAYNKCSYGKYFTGNFRSVSIDWNNLTLSFEFGILIWDGGQKDLSSKSVIIGNDSGIIYLNKVDYNIYTADYASNDDSILNALTNKDAVIMGTYYNTNKVLYIFGYGHVQYNHAIAKYENMNKPISNGSKNNIHAVIDNDNNMTITFAGFIPEIGRALNTSITIENVFDNFAGQLYYDAVGNGIVANTSWNALYSNTGIKSYMHYIGYWYNEKVHINGAKVVYSYPKGSINVNNQLKVKYQVAAFGDSITAGVGCTVPYHYYAHLYGDHYCRNYGIGSIGYITTTNSTIRAGQGIPGNGVSQVETGNNTILDVIQRNIDTISNGRDAITIAAGTNDYSRNHSLSSFENALRTCWEWVLNNTDCPLIIVTPIHRAGTEINSSNISLRQYVDTMIETARDMQLPIINMYDNIPLHPNYENRKAIYIPDGLHPSNVGQQMMGAYYNECLNAILAKY